MGVTSPRGREQSYSEDSQTELPRGSKCESPWLVSLQQQAPSPGLPLHPGTSWSPGGRRDSLGLSRQPPGLESPPPGICAHSVIDAAWLAAASAAMWEACVRGRERPPGPAGVQPKPQPLRAGSDLSSESPGGSMELTQPKPRLSRVPGRHAVGRPQRRGTNRAGGAGAPCHPI